MENDGEFELRLKRGEGVAVYSMARASAAGS
jgi:hypothetical protein